MSTIPTIPEFYTGRSIFITGATGFLGKVLVEKLLRSCPGVKTIYLLIRPKKGKNSQERLEEIFHSTLFDKVRDQDPEFQEKCFAVEGDIVKDGLGIDQSQEEILAREVSVVFHSAATIKFDEEMKLSVEMNVLGVQRMLELGKKLPNLVSFVHISTAYANCNVMEVREEIYPPPLLPRQLLSAVSWMDAETLDMLTPKMIGSRPNTYTYTKSIAESLVKETAGSLPVAIFRPSIVGATYQEPVSGWVDNLNGVTGILAAAGKGVLRIMKADYTATADIIPVDMATNMMVAVGWYTATHNPGALKVYNCTTGQIKRITWGQFEELTYECFIKNPLENVARLPSTRITTNIIWHDLNLIFDHLLPAYMMDFFMWVFGKKKMFVRIHNKIQKAVACLDFFSTKSWTFTNENMLILEKAMSAEDRETFNFNPKRINWRSYMEAYCMGIKKFVLKEELSKLPEARKALTRLQRIHRVLNILMFIIIWRLCVGRSRIARVLWNMVLGWAEKILRIIPGFGKSARFQSRLKCLEGLNMEKRHVCEFGQCHPYE